MKRSTIYLTAGIAAAAAWWFWRKQRQPPPITKINSGAAAPEFKSLPPSTAGQKFAGANSSGVAGAGRPTDTRISLRFDGPVERSEIRRGTRTPGKQKVTHRG